MKTEHDKKPLENENDIEKPQDTLVESSNLNEDDKVIEQINADIDTKPQTEDTSESSLYDDFAADDSEKAPLIKSKKQWVAIALAAALASFSLYFSMSSNEQRQQESLDQLAQLKAVKQSLIDVQSRLQTSSEENKTLQASLVTLKSNNAQQQAELAKLPTQLHTQQAEQFEQYQSWIQQSLNKTEKAWSDSSLAWRLAEIEFLLNGAHQTVIARGDHKTAAQMLALADQRMGEIFQKDPQAVKEVIAQAQLVLQNYQPANVLKLYNQILALETQIKSWQWQNAKSVAADFTKAEASISPQEEKKWYQRLDGYIKVRRATELDTNTILAPSQLEQVRLILLSSTATLKAAAAEQNAELFTLALNDLSTWSQSYLPEENQRISIATQISIWQDEKFEHQRPDVFKPVSIFNEWKQELMP